MSRKNGSGLLFGIGATFVVGTILTLVLMMIGVFPTPVKVNQGETLVVAYNLGDNKGTVEEYKSGRQWPKAYYSDWFSMPNSIQEESYDTFNIVSRDNQRMPVQLTLKYQVNPVTGCASALYIDYRKNIDKIIDTDLRTSTRDLAFRTFADFGADEIFGNQIGVIADQMTAAAQEGSLIRTRNDAGDLCLLVESIKIQDVDADESIKRAVSEKLVRDQEVQEEQAQTLIVQEQLRQDSLRIAQQALNNREIQATITDEVLEMKRLELQEQWINRWNGQLPTTMLGSGEGQETLFMFGK